MSQGKPKSPGVDFWTPAIQTRSLCARVGKETINPEFHLSRRAAIQTLLTLPAAGLFLACSPQEQPQEVRKDYEYHDYPLVNPRFIDAINHGAIIEHPTKVRHKPDVLKAVHLKMDDAKRKEIETFLTKNFDQNHTEVIKWLQENDLFWTQNYGEGLQNEDLEKAIEILLKKGLLKRYDGEKNRHLTFHVDPNGVTEDEKFRRVIRTDHLPTMEELALRLNELLRGSGMDENYFISPLVNGTVRSVEANEKEGSGSQQSAHLMFSAVDLSDKWYLVQKFAADGKIIRYRDKKNKDKFLDALKRVVYEMAKEGKIKVRYHDGHFHMVPMVQTE